MLCGLLHKRNMSLWRFGFWLCFAYDIKLKNLYIRMRNNSNVAALVFIGAPVYIICRYGALAFGYASQRLVVCFPLRVPSAKMRVAIFLFCTNYFNTT